MRSTVASRAGQAAPRRPREAILTAAATVIRSDPAATLEAVAAAAGVSRATLYRYFGSRADLLAAADLEPDRGTRDRILAAAGELVGRDGLRSLSMDELAAVAGVSRASVYRLFPGKAALFEALILAYSPFEPVEMALARLGDRPPEEVLPEIARVAAMAVEPRIGIVRSLLFEVTSGSADAVEGALPALRRLVEALGGYVVRQMALGRIRPMNPVLVIQVLLGPIVLHLLTRSIAERMLAFDLPLDAAVADMTGVAIRGLTTQP
jgi:AcrR family transcriptional regulator